MNKPNNNDIYAYQPLFGSWNIEEEIGEGSFGTVYRVSKEEMGRNTNPLLNSS
jgi:hypothetical protein